MLSTFFLPLSFTLSLLLFQFATPTSALSSANDVTSSIRDYTVRLNGRRNKHRNLSRRRRSSLKARADAKPVEIDGVGPSGSTVTRLAGQAPGVINTLGRDQDPSPLTYQLLGGQKQYLFPTGDFGKNILYRVNSSLSDVYNGDTKVLYSFDSSIGTEASDLVAWDTDTALLTVSATSDNTLRSVTFSLSSFFSGGSGKFQSHGTIRDQNGNALQGFDSHVFVHPNGKRYLTYSNHVSIRIAKMTSFNTVADDTMLVATSPTQSEIGPGLFYNTEAPATAIFPNRNGSYTINLCFATGDFANANYNTRMMFIDAGRNPLNVNNWYVVKQSFLQSSDANQAFAPGSGGFFSGPDGQTWFAYGGYDRKSGQGGPTGNYPRSIRVQVAPVNEQGQLLPTTPVKTPRHTT